MALAGPAATATPAIATSATAPPPDASPSPSASPVATPDALDAGEDAANAPPFDQYAWAEARGVPNSDGVLMRLGSCRAVSVGQPPREALLCEGGAPDFSVPGGESVFSLRVVDVAKGRLRELLVAPLYAGAMDFPGVEYVHLSASLSTDGLRVTIAERPEETCDAARAKARKQFSSPVDAPGLRDWLTTIGRACAGRGVYVWRNGRFLR